MTCVNSQNLVYLQTYNKSQTELIKIDSSVGVYEMNRKNFDFFYVQFSDSGSFKVYPLDKFIDSDTLQKIRSGNLFLVLGNALEYFTDTVDSIYRDIIIKENIPAEKVIFLSAVPTMINEVKRVAQKYNLPELKLEWMTLFEATGKDAIKSNNNLMPAIKKTKKWPKKYLCLNRRWRLHRPFMVSMLYDRNLIQYGHISLATSDNPAVDNWNSAFKQLRNIYSNHEDILALICRCSNIKNRLGELYLDTTDLATNRAMYEDTIAPFYEDTFFSVVNETTYHEGIPFLSEKIFKVIAMGHPFILSSAPNTLQYLHKLGYKTFDPIIDESYDAIESNKERMVAIVDQIEKLCKMDKQQTAAFISKIRPIVQHNFDNLKLRTRKGISTSMN